MRQLFLILVAVVTLWATVVLGDEAALQDPATWIERAEELTRDVEDKWRWGQIAEAWMLAGHPERAEKASEVLRRDLWEAIERFEADWPAWQAMTPQEQQEAGWRADPAVRLEQRVGHWSQLALPAIASGDSDRVLKVLDEKDEWVNRVVQLLPETQIDRRDGEAVVAHWSVEGGLDELVEPILERQLTLYGRQSVLERSATAFAERGDRERARELFVQANELGWKALAEVREALPAGELTYEQVKELENAVYMALAIPKTAAQHGVFEPAFAVAADDALLPDPGDQLNLYVAVLRGASESGDWQAVSESAARAGQEAMKLIEAGHEPQKDYWLINGIADLAAHGDASRDWEADLLSVTPMFNSHLEASEAIESLANGFLAAAHARAGNFEEMRRLLTEVYQADPSGAKDLADYQLIHSAQNGALLATMAALIQTGEAERAQRLPSQVVLTEPTDEPQDWTSLVQMRDLEIPAKGIAELLADHGQAEAALAIAESDLDGEVELDDIAGPIAAARGRNDLLERLWEEIGYREDVGVGGLLAVANALSKVKSPAEPDADAS